jgi:hypothetical protein
MSDQNPPKGAQRFEWLGTNLGSITRSNPETGNSYRVGFNLDDRFVWVAKEDVAWVEGQPEAFRAAPLDAPAKTSKAAKATEPDAVAPAVNAPVAESKAKAPTKDA